MAAEDEGWAFFGAGQSRNNVRSRFFCGQLPYVGDSQGSESFGEQFCRCSFITRRVRTWGRDEAAREVQQFAFPSSQKVLEAKSSLFVGDVCAKRASHFAAFDRCNNPPSRRIPSSISRTSPASETRTKPWPPGPKTSPGATATFSSLRSFIVKSIADMPASATSINI